MISLEQAYFFESSAFNEEASKKLPEIRGHPHTEQQGDHSTHPPCSPGWGLIPALPQTKEALLCYFLALKTLCCQFGFPVPQPTSEDVIC